MPLHVPSSTGAMEAVADSFVPMIEADPASRQRRRSALLAQLPSRKRVHVGAGMFEGMTVVLRCGGEPQFPEGAVVYMRSAPRCPYIVLVAALGIKTDGMSVASVYLVERCTARGMVAFWTAETTLIRIGITVMDVSATSAADVPDGHVAVCACDGQAPYAFVLAARAPDGRFVALQQQRGTIVDFPGLPAGTYRVVLMDSMGSCTDLDVAVSVRPDADRRLARADGALCIACCNADRVAIFLPCRHMGTCMECAHTAMRSSVRQGAPFGVCPFCRGPITKVVKAILP